MLNVIRACIAVLVLTLQAGCFAHNVKFIPFAKAKIPPTSRAVALTGTIEEAKAYFDRAQLPHNSPREKYSLMLEGASKLTAQLGSPDYFVIGEVVGGGSARASLSSLTQAMCVKASQNGGDVVMLFSQGIVERPYVYTTPGYSSTNASASAYNYGNYTNVYGSSHTTYSPPETYSGTLHLPRANGLVFKLLPGIDAQRRSILIADDAAIATAIEETEQLMQEKKLTWDEVLFRWNEIVAKATGMDKRQTVTTKPNEPT